MKDLVPEQLKHLDPQKLSNLETTTKSCGYKNIDYLCTQSG